MNLLIDTLNVWADHALRFAWPMLWQSSLLIGFLFALDLLMRRKLRPAVRYTLWLVVLIKLSLPPSLAFPTGPGYWLRPAKAAPARPRPTSVVVTFGSAESPALSLAATPVFTAPSRPRLTPAAWAFVGVATVSLGLFAWMLARWRQAARDARRAAAAPAWLSEEFPQLRRPARLRLTDHPQSPAVCGLFRPVILLPRPLLEQLPPAQLRAVLLHELIHLRRGDVWVNCAQALLQIAYWWHPLLWLANARIRRVREEAVDDAVMLALNEDAETYAPTLLEVAKLALHRPLASLGLVGILESRGSLRQRIERLMDFRPPRKAGLTLGSALAVLGFAALAVPMGEAPAPTEVTQIAGSQMVTNNPASNGPPSVSSSDKQTNAGTLVQNGKLLYEMGKLDEAEAKLKLALKIDPPNQAARYYLNLVSEAKVAQAAKAHNPDHTGQGRQAILRKLKSIRFDTVSYEALPLGEVVRFLAEESRKRDPEKLGVNFILTRGTSTNAPGKGDLSSLPITIQPPLTNICLADVLDAIMKVAGQPIKYSIEDYAVVFAAKPHQESPPLYTRTFKVDPSVLLDGLHLAKGTAWTNGPGAIAPALRELFAKAGADLDPVKNPAKVIFYNDRQGTLVVRATLQDLDIIEQMIVVLNAPPPQINIKCKFVEVPQDDTKALGFDWYLGNTLVTNGTIGGQAGATSTTIVANSTNQLMTSGLRTTSPATLTSILTDPQFRVVMNALQQRSGVDLLAAPEITTMSGRQARMMVGETLPVVTGINERALTPPGITITNGDESPLYATNSMEFGTKLDVTASVLADGYTIALTVKPRVTEFLGYEEDPTNRVAVYVNGKKKWITPPPQPHVRQQQMSASVRVWDGQTIVLGGLLSETVNTLKDKVPVLGDLPLLGRLFRSESKNTSKKNLLVFVTPTLIDPAGNRVHSEEHMPAHDAIPPQPPH